MFKTYILCEENAQNEFERKQALPIVPAKLHGENSESDIIAKLQFRINDKFVNLQVIKRNNIVYSQCFVDNEEFYNSETISDEEFSLDQAIASFFVHFKEFFFE